MMRLVQINISIVLVLISACNTDSLQEIEELNKRIDNNVQSLDIKPIDRKPINDQFDFNGEKNYAVQFYDNENVASCIVQFIDDSVTVKHDGSMDLDKGILIDTGILKRHEKSGNLIISHDESDTTKEGVGTCFSDLVVVDLLNKVVWLCQEMY